MYLKKWLWEIFIVGNFHSGHFSNRAYFGVGSFLWQLISVWVLLFWASFAWVFFYGHFVVGNFRFEFFVWAKFCLPLPITTHYFELYKKNRNIELVSIPRSKKRLDWAHTSTGLKHMILTFNQRCVGLMR